MPRPFQIFGHGDLEDQFLNRFLQEVRPKVHGKSVDYILNVNDEDFIEHIATSLSVEVPIIDLENRTVSHYEKMVRPEDFPDNTYFRSSGPFPHHAIVFRYPISGDPEILQYAPMNGYRWCHDCYIDDGDICFDVLERGRPSETVLAEWTQAENYFRTNYTNIVKQCESHTERVRQTASQFIRERKVQFLRENNYMAAMGIPLKKNPNMPGTFAIPKPDMRRKIVPAPVVTETGYKAEPTLQERDYQQILQIIHGAGRAMEQHPSLYRDKDEESIRDLFLFQLAPHYEGSTTGETFNAAGKTDILMSWQGGNAFVAECKFWTGPAAFVDKAGDPGPISQLLHYLTWRDSKTALLTFVRNKEITPVTEQVSRLVSEHPNFLRMEIERDESWIEYRFHLNGDKNREMKMAVMLFHLPEA